MISRYSREAIVVLVLLVLPLTLFWQTTLGGQTLVPGDNLYQWEPFASFAGEQGVGIPHNELVSDLVLENYAWKRFLLRSFRQPGGLTHRLPLWNPYLWAGAPFLADGQHSALYPFSVLFYLLPLPHAYGWFTVLQFWLAGCSMYLLARTLGTSRVGGLIAGMVYQLSSVYVVSVVFTMIIAAMVWLPLLLAAIEHVIRQQMRGGSGMTLPTVAGGAVALGMQMLAGHPEFTYYTGLVMGVYALARLIREVAPYRSRGFHTASAVRRGPKVIWLRALKAGGWLLAMVALGGLIGAAQFVPLYEFAAHNFRHGSESYETIVGWAFPPRRVIAMLIPNFFGNPSHHTWFDLLKWQRMPVTHNLNGGPTDPPNTIYWGIKNAVEGGSYVGILPLLLALIAVIGAWGDRKQGPRSAGAESTKHKAQSGTELGTCNLKPATCNSFPTWFFAGLAAFSLSLVFGLPTYRIVFALPFINQLHSPFRWLFPYTLSVAVLAGLGTTCLGRFGLGDCLPLKKQQTAKGAPTHDTGDCLATKGGTAKTAPRNDSAAVAPGWRERVLRLLGWAALGAGIIGLIALLVALPMTDRLEPLAERAVRSLAKAEGAFESGRMFLMVQWPNLGLFFLALAASGGVLLVRRSALCLPDRLGGVAAWKPLALLVVALDLFLAGYGFNPAADPRWLECTPPSIAFLQARQAEDPHFRVISYSAPGDKTLNANIPWLYDLQDVRGYGSIILKQYADYMGMIYPQYELLYNRIAPISTDHPQALDSPLLDLLNCKYVVTTQEIDSPKYRLAYEGEVRVYENLGAMPRAFTLPESSAVYAPDMAAAIRQYDPRFYVLLERAPVAPNDPIAGHPEAATISFYGHNEVFVDVDLDAPGWLILADTHFLGWRAYVRPFGGVEAEESELEIYRHAGNFRAVRLPAGQHTVRFKYTPNSVKVGFFLAFLGGATLALMLGVWVWRRTVRRSAECSDARRVARNSVAPIVLQLFNKLVDMAFIMLALRILGPQGAGQYYFVVNIIVYTDVLINFGLNTYLQREVSRAREEGSRYLGNAILLRLALSAAAAPLLLLFVLLWPPFTQFMASLGGTAAAETLSAAQVWALALFALGLIPGNVAAALTALFQANEYMEHPAAITVVSTLVKAALGTAALLLGWGIVGLGGVSIVTNLITLIILLVLTVRMFFVPRLALDRPLQREMRRESWPLMVNNLLSMGFFKADVILLKAMQGDLVLGLYSSVAYKLIDAINIVPISFTFALFPLMSRYARESREAMSRAYHLAVRLLVLVALPLAMALTLLAYPIANVIGGSGYMPDSAIALQLMIWSIPVGFINSVTHYVLIALGRQRQLMGTFAVGLGFNVVANVLAIPVWGYRASAVIHIFSELVLLIAFLVLLRRDLPPVPWARMLWRPAVAGVWMAVIGGLLYGVNVLLAAVAALVTYAVALCILGIAREPDMEVVRELVPGLERLRGMMPVRDA